MRLMGDLAPAHPRAKLTRIEFGRSNERVARGRFGPDRRRLLTLKRHSKLKKRHVTNSKCAVEIVPAQAAVSKSRGTTGENTN